MTSSLRLLVSLSVALKRATLAGWPDATQGSDGVSFNLNGVNLAVWNGAFAQNVEVAAGATVTVDLRNFTSLLFETGALLARGFLVVAVVNADDPTHPNCVIQVNPGAANGWKGPFVGANGLALANGQLFVWSCAAAEAAGIVTDATHKTLDLTNVGADNGTLTLIVVGGTV